MVLMEDVVSGRMILSEGSEMARLLLLPPGSTLKPLVLLALLRQQLLRPEETYSCPGVLHIAGRQLNCSHPRLSQPLSVADAISYSCNCAIAHFASRFKPADLAEELARAGLKSRTGLLPGAEATGVISSRGSEASLQLLALGEEGIRITPLELLRAYRGLAQGSAPTMAGPIVSGLEGAVAFGTAQKARVDGISVAGKTGTVRAESGNRYGWFAGFAPSHQPQVALTVLVRGTSGGSDAAPIASRVLAAYFARKS